MARQMLRPTYSFEAAKHLGSGMLLASARIPSAAVLLHVERLRHLAIVARVAPAEFWAVLHHGDIWCSQAWDSVRWLASSLALAGKPQRELDSWETSLGVIDASPGTWKSWIRRAQQTALLKELWEAEHRHFYGLLFRSLLAAGATVDDELATRMPSFEVCAVCQQGFRDLRSWSHHAFKRHGRVREARKVAQGTQCQVCLRHFASNFRLTNHLEHSAACLAALVQSQCFVEAVPGRGSKRFQDGKDVLLPAVTAHGPVAQWDGTGYIPESERPESSILLALEEIFSFPGDVCDYAGLIEALRKAFSGVCLQSSRLRATACAWRNALTAELGGNEDISIQWAAWHRKAADFVCAVDFSEWLVPEAVPTTDQHATYRDGILLLPWLSYDSLHIPPCSCECDFGLRLISGERRFLGRQCVRGEWISHDSCSAQPSRLDFEGWASAGRGTATVLDVSGLTGSTTAPSLVRNFRTLLPGLQRLRLFADLVRGALFLWTRGVPAIIVAPPVDCPGIAALKRIAHDVSVSGDATVMSNFPGFTCDGYSYLAEPHYFYRPKPKQAKKKKASKAKKQEDDDDEDFEELEPFPGLKVVLPTAPRRPITCYKGEMQHAWHDYITDHEGEREDELSAEDLQQTTERVHKMLDAEAALVGARNVYLGGASQGCGTAL
ncbi:unnamed protein product, partial [Symbiodinium sp. CCMP2456]